MGFANPCQTFLGMNIVAPLSKRCGASFSVKIPLPSIESFVHPKVSVDRNAPTGRQLLGPQGEIVGAGGGAGLDEDIAGVPKMNEMFAFGSAVGQAAHVVSVT